jgi:hypothetical protein
VDLLARRQPALASRTRFLMLGGGNSLFDQSLTALLRELHRPQLVVHPSSADYFPYYAAADLFVCSTYEESSPRVILEAMAFGTPILSSEVHGIGEQVRNGREAMLVPPGNTHALAEGLATLLQASGLRQTLAAAARQKVRSEFDPVSHPPPTCRPRVRACGLCYRTSRFSIRRSASMNENDAYIFDVEQPSQWTFPPGKTWVAGWFLSKTGARFNDLRLRLDDRICYGIFGQPRQEIEQKYRSYTGLPHAGFSFLIEPHIGAKLLRLEILDHGNNWVEIWRRKIKVPRGRLRRRPVLDSTQVADVIGTLLKARRAEPEADLAPLARRLAEEASAESLNVLPSPPFWGALEEPSHVGHSQFGKLPTTGWLIHEKQRIRSRRRQHGPAHRERIGSTASHARMRSGSFHSTLRPHIPSSSV